MANKNTKKNSKKTKQSSKKELEKRKAIEAIQDSARNFLTAKVTLPLGNPLLKKVHTNQFIWMELNEDFTLENWDTIAKAFNSSFTRYSGYEENRWYIDGVTIDVDASGKADMQLDLNAFASPTSSYTSDYRSFEKAYTDTFNKKNNQTSTNKTTSNATNKNNKKLFPTKAGKNVGGDLKKALDLIIQDCNTEEQKAYCIYDWVDKYVNYEFFYTNDRGYSCSYVLTHHGANCWCTAHLIYKLCTMAKVRCKIMNGYYHFAVSGSYGHTWNELPYKGKMTFADTGRTGRNPIGSHNGGYIESASVLKKNY